MRATEVTRRNPAWLLRMFGVGAAVTVLAGAAVTALGVYRLYFALVTRSGERTAVAVSRALLEETPRLFVPGGQSGLTPPGPPFPEVDVRVRRYMSSFPVVSVTVLDDRARVVYSSTASVPATSAADPRIARALRGERSSVIAGAGGAARSDVVDSIVPVRNGDRVIGAVRVATDVGWSRAEFRHVLAMSMLFVAGAGLAGVALLYALMRGAIRQVDQAQRDLETMAVTDSLTLLANRRYLMTRAAEECARIPRLRARGAAKAGVGFIMADVDGFKQVNDTHGHLVGDDILRGVADRIRRITRRYDVVGRYGGDEFLVVVPDTDYDETRAVAERLWQAVREDPFTIGGSTVGMTVSVGFTCASDDDVHGAMRRADEALYRAKNAGRDRIIAV